MQAIDGELKAMIDVLPRISDYEERRRMKDSIARRRMQIQAGIDRVPRYVNDMLQVFDPMLRMRWDFDQRCYALERHVENEGIYLVVTYHRDEHGPKRIGQQAILQLIADLAANDLQKRRPEEHVEAKREQAETVVVSNDQKAEQKILGAIDSLPAKNIQEMCNVEAAISRGDKVLSHGSDEKFLERAHANTKKMEAEGIALDNPNAAINPGQNPMIWKGKKR